jgi:hypothetical protein
MKSGYRLIAVLATALSFNGSASAVECKTQIDIPQRLLDSRLTLLGELHGTSQIPDFVGAYVCNLASKVRSVALALEYEEEEQPLIDAYLASDGGIKARRALLRKGRWAVPIQNQDGRTSKAMFALLEGVRQYNKTEPTRSIKVRAISGPDDASMSRNVRALALENQSVHIVALTGELHASTGKGNVFDPAAEPMGYLLRDLLPISLVAEYDEGMAWNCFGAGKCGPHLSLSMPIERGARFSISMRPPSERPGFDGSFYVGKIEASMPAD